VPATLGLMHAILVVLHQKPKDFLFPSLLCLTYSHAITCSHAHMLKQCLIGQLGRLASEFSLVAIAGVLNQPKISGLA